MPTLKKRTHCVLRWWGIVAGIAMRWRGDCGDCGDYSSLYGRSSTMRVASFQMPMKSPVSELYA